MHPARMSYTLVTVVSQSTSRNRGFFTNRLFIADNTVELCNLCWRGFQISASRWIADSQRKSKTITRIEKGMLFPCGEADLNPVRVRTHQFTFVKMEICESSDVRHNLISRHYSNRRFKGSPSSDLTFSRLFHFPKKHHM